MGAINENIAVKVGLTVQVIFKQKVEGAEEVSKLTERFFRSREF